MATSTTGVGGDNDITGTDCADKIIAGGGDDTINGAGGSDFINAGGGNDTIIYDQYDYKILGGGGIDTLLFLAGGQTLTLGDRIVSGIEKISFGESSGNIVTFSAADIVRVSDTDQMIISGDGSNHINPGAGWTFGGLTADGQSQILVNGLAKLIVALPVDVEGFSKNSVINTSIHPELYGDTLLSCEGIITVSDPNQGQGLLVDSPYFTGTHAGTLSIELIQSGSPISPAIYRYHYSISSDSLQNLGPGEVLPDSFTLTSIDGTSTTLSFANHGTHEYSVTFNGSEENDVIIGTDGNDKMYGAGGSNFFFTGDGNDYAEGGSDKDALWGEGGNDILMGQDGGDSFNGGKGNDYLVGAAGNDTLLGGQGDDQIFGGAGNDLIVGDDGDINAGGDGDDYISGGDGDDFLSGYGGNDFIDGGNGNDHIQIWSGFDILMGGDGNDTFAIIDDTTGNSTIIGGSGTDVIYISNIDSASRVAITDFNVASPDSGGDVLDLRDLSIASLASLSLMPSAAQDNLYVLQINTGTGQSALISLLGVGLTMEALADNILIH